VNAVHPRISRKDHEAAEAAAAAQASAETARYERLEQRVRRTINTMFWIAATLWIAGLGVIVGWEWLQWHR
jgi:fatty acid desaturase